MVSGRGSRHAKVLRQQELDALRTEAQVLRPWDSNVPQFPTGQAATGHSQPLGWPGDNRALLSLFHHPRRQPVNAKGLDAPPCHHLSTVTLFGTARCILQGVTRDCPGPGSRRGPVRSWLLSQCPFARGPSFCPELASLRKGADINTVLTRGMHGRVQCEVCSPAPTPSANSSSPAELGGGPG